MYYNDQHGLVQASITGSNDDDNADRPNVRCSGKEYGMEITLTFVDGTIIDDVQVFSGKEYFGAFLLALCMPVWAFLALGGLANTKSGGIGAAVEANDLMKVLIHVKSAFHLLWQKKQLLIWLVGIGLGSTALRSVFGEASTFLITEMNLSPYVYGLLFTLVGFAVILGAYVFFFFGRLIGFQKSLSTAFLVLGISSVIISVAVVELGDVGKYWILGFLNGFAFGGIYALRRGIIASWIPKGYAGVFFGIYALVTEIFFWIFPLCFGTCYKDSSYEPNTCGRIFIGPGVLFLLAAVILFLLPDEMNVLVVKQPEEVAIEQAAVRGEPDAPVEEVSIREGEIIAEPEFSPPRYESLDITSA